MTSTTTLTMIDGVRVVVPDSLDLITPYVLQEQEDWFEDEIKFLRCLLQPGQKVIDVGANYGVYTLSMAKTVGPTGSVWAFEPASSTAKLLAEGVAANGFAQVVLERSALSSASGSAQISLHENSELNALVRDASLASASETVPVVTLDECMERYKWRDIEFMKIDAEGEEANILRGGERFFAELSPLVQYEVKAGVEIYMGLVKRFASIGYASYRLVPGLDILVFYDSESTPDGYLLNLFCCKQDRVAQLAARGFLINPADQRLTTEAERTKGILKKVNNHNTCDWRHTIAKLPYGIQLANLWEQTIAEGNSEEVDEALFFYAISRDSSLSSTVRYGALETSLNMLKNLCESDPSYLRLSSLARVASDYGARSLAVNALVQLIEAIQRHNQVDMREPFLVPGRQFDTVPPGKTIGAWVQAAVLEEFERLSSFSSYYSGVSALQRLEIIRDLGFGSDEMARRLNLIKQRFGMLDRAVQATQQT